MSRAFVVLAVTCLWPAVFGTRQVKAQPSTADMAAKLRRVIIAARFKASRPDQPTPEEISILRLAWEDRAA